MTQRTQLILDDSAYVYLKEQAGENGLSMSECVRQLVREKMKKGASKSGKKDPFAKMVGAFKGPIGAGGRNAEDELYGNSNE